MLPSAPSHLTVWPTDRARPDASNLNVTPGIVVPNLVMAALSPAGEVSLYNNSGTVDVLFDVVGYFSTAEPLGSVHGVTPSRILDTRPGSTVGGPTAPLGPGETRELVVTGVGGVPGEGVSAVVLNVTADRPSATSHLTVWPAGVDRPTASNLNFAAGTTIPNLVVAKVGAGGKVSIFNSSGAVEVLADVVGYVSG
ncbi:MAG: hypothetical protein R2726_12135 [Acidimicrobiales bacterium]